MPVVSLAGAMARKLPRCVVSSTSTVGIPWASRTSRAVTPVITDGVWRCKWRACSVASAASMNEVLRTKHGRNKVKNQVLNYLQCTGQDRQSWHGLPRWLLLRFSWRVYVGPCIPGRSCWPWLLVLVSQCFWADLQCLTRCSMVKIGGYPLWTCAHLHLNYFKILLEVSQYERKLKRHQLRFQLMHEQKLKLT